MILTLEMYSFNFIVIAREKFIRFKTLFRQSNSIKIKNILLVRIIGIITDFWEVGAVFSYFKIEGSFFFNRICVSTQSVCTFTLTRVFCLLNLLLFCYWCYEILYFNLKKISDNLFKMIWRAHIYIIKLIS